MPLTKCDASAGQIVNVRADHIFRKDGMPRTRFVGNLCPEGSVAVVKSRERNTQDAASLVSSLHGRRTAVDVLGRRAGRMKPDSTSQTKWLSAVVLGACCDVVLQALKC
jgi:hypothetical protein